MPTEGSHSSSGALGEEPGSRFTRYMSDAPRHGQVSDMVFKVLQEAILDGTLLPSSWLRENELAREMSVSRTPVRESLRRLAVEGLVVITAHQGAMVAPLSMEDILEVYVVRETLEGLASRQAARHRTEEQLARLEEILERMRNASSHGSPQDLARLNLEFHRVIRKAARNHFLDRFLAQIEHAVRRFGKTTYEFPEWTTDSLEEHRKIIEALRLKDSDAAERLATEHMRHARRLRLKLLLDE